MATLALMRHGLSQANIDAIVAGHLETPLVDIGRQQAKDAATALRQRSFNRAFGSPLQRAKETLQIVLNELQQEIPATFHDELKERAWGDVEGTKYGERAGGKYSEEEAATWHTWIGKAEGGESYEDMEGRVVPFFEIHVLPRLKAGENVLIVFHNGISKPLQRYIENTPHEEIHTLNMQNCEVKLYEFNENGFVQKLSSP